MLNRGAWGVDASFGASCLRYRASRDLLRTIAAWERRQKPALSRDLVSQTKRSSATLLAQLEKMADEGLLTVEGGHNSVKLARLTEHGRAMANRCGAPLLGTVPAGMLRAVPETDGRDGEGAQMYLDTWDEQLPPTEEYGVLVVRGESMIGEHIRPGDRVQLRLGVRLHEVEPGQICAVTVKPDYEATLKYVFPGEDFSSVTLRAANPMFPDLCVARDDLHIVGTLFGLVRTFGNGHG